ncbi:NAD-dependent epimerase/dehydratase family protein [Variovorax sp. J22G21]|uniref:NAD-dependent epimerase/dehydratase family protein n=1 Tax=Variovorax fucosicus TaxID=3053517 RepID=UPI002576BFEE|nr:MULTISPECIES: NAD-dependent epimerase/dehydratase family protein [unclassified Variovorax]MDM0038517.1 NAD-dependent epimerase/dehydratase family protein [Variovorax sp. J22R193]MDM0055813.1 NAD-dependent epimerase/dehydratase family protein [Variovorax sp. J22G47]MDM0063293.1 NAD-dependent epimerase/dehydratase family protein [Variovorax sp. J22G21]
MTSHVVVGGCGFLGRHLARGLKQSGEDVAVVDICPFPAESTISIQTRRFDILEASTPDFDAMIDGADVVHHYAWTTLPASANADPFADARDNLRITIGLLDALKRRGKGRMVFASSGGTVYGKLRTIPVPEDHHLQPITAYGVSKVAAENYLRLYRHLHGVDSRVVRISNPYGAGQNPSRQQGAVTTFVHRAMHRVPIEIWGDGETVRDYIHVMDVVPALIAASRMPSADELEMPIFNVGSGQRYTLREIVKLVEAALGESLEINWKPTRPFDVPISVLDIGRAKRELNWAPEIDLQAGILRMIQDLSIDEHRQYSS